MKNKYYKYIPLSNGFWRKEEIKQRCYPINIGIFDCIALKSDCGLSWEVRHAGTSFGLVTGEHACIKTKKEAIKQANELINSKTAKEIECAEFYIKQHETKFSEMPLNQDIDLGDFLGRGAK